MKTQRNKSQDSSSTNESKKESKKIKFAKPTIDDCRYCPKWQLEELNNKHIYDGYRLNYRTYWDLIKSVWDIHNETCNIWSHFLGALLFVFLLYYNYTHFSDPFSIKDTLIRQKMENSKNQIVADFMLGGKMDIFYNETMQNFPSNKTNFEIASNVWAILSIKGIINIDFDPSLMEFGNFFEEINYPTILSNQINLTPFFIFHLTVILCFTLSTLMHTFWVKSEEDNKFFSRLDYGGIIIMITGSVTSGIYYAIPCVEFRFWYIYLTLILASVKLVLINMSFLDNVSKKFKAGIFVLKTCVSILPILHWIFLT